MPMITLSSTPFDITMPDAGVHSVSLTVSVDSGLSEVETGIVIEWLNDAMRKIAEAMNKDVLI